MRSFVLIFAALLSFISGGGLAGYACDRNIHYTNTVVQCTGKDVTDTKTDFNDLAVLPVRTASYSGDGSSFAPSFRPTNSGRRIQPSTKSAFRLIKDGKVYDRNNLNAFRAVILQFQSGIRSNSRYIHSICQLLI